MPLPIPTVRMVFGDSSMDNSHNYSDVSITPPTEEEPSVTKTGGRITTFESKYSTDSDSKISLSRTWLASSVDLQPTSPSSSPSSPLKNSETSNRESTYTPKDANGNFLIAPWGIHWYTPVSIVSFFIAGVACAIIHHFLYNSLHGTLAGDTNKQEWTNRIGTGLAFLSRAALSAVMEISRKQWVWVTLRKQFLTLEAINAMFGVATDPLHFLRGEMLLRAKFTTFTAVLIWALPLVAIFTPSTISVVPTDEHSVSSCVVPSLDFKFDASPVDGLRWYTFAEGNTLGDIYEEVYHNPSPRASSIFTTAAFSGNATTAGAVSTLAEQSAYKIQFVAPAVNCTEIASWVEDDPLSNTTVPKQSVNGLSPIFSAARAEKVWNELLVGNLREPGQNTSQSEFEWHTYSCKNSVARYSLSLEISGGRYREPVIDNVEILYPVTAEPSFNTTYSRVYISSWALFDTLIDILAGDVSIGINHFNYSMDGQEYYKSTQETRITRTKVMSTSLASPESTANDMKTVPMLAEAIEDMVQKMVVSLLSDRSLIYATNVTSTCTSTESYNIYSYNWQRLVIVYSIGGVATLVIGVLGIVALSKNGVASDDSFSTFLLTTRNPTLDKLAAGACLGGEPLPNELKKLKFKFGELPGQRHVDGIRHAALGVEGEVVDIQRGGKYS